VKDQEPLTIERLECLRRCSQGISIRFESRQITNALIEGGYAERNVAGVITVTAKGLEYLRKLNYT
jgi:predicted metal-binding protein